MLYPKSSFEFGTQIIIDIHLIIEQLFTRMDPTIQIHERLKVNDKGRPKLQIFKTCPNLIREIQSIPLDPNKPEDVDTKASDHAYDALRYLIMSRPKARSVWDEMTTIKRWTPSDPTFGY